MTLPGTTLGSVQYMSPEQARGETATERSDIYALGVVLFEMLAGRRPFEGDSAAAIAMARLTPPVPMPSVYRAGIPPVLEAICRKAMAIDPAERFHSANAMADALDDELADRAAAAGGPVGAAAAGAAVAAGVARANPPIPYAPDAYVGVRRDASSAAAGVHAPSRRRTTGGAGPWAWIAGLLGLGILLAVGFLAFRLLTGGSTPAPEQVVVPNFVGQTLDQPPSWPTPRASSSCPSSSRATTSPRGRSPTRIRRRTRPSTPARRSRSRSSRASRWWPSRTSATRRWPRRSRRSSRPA